MPTVVITNQIAIVLRRDPHSPNVYNIHEHSIDTKRFLGEQSTD